MAKEKTHADDRRLIPYRQIGRLKRALPRLIEQELAGEAGITADAPWSMSIPDAGKRYFGLGRQMSYAVAYPITSATDD